jgi:hypothetical protein
VANKIFHDVAFVMSRSDFGGEAITILKAKRKERLVKKKRQLTTQQEMFDAGEQRFRQLPENCRAGIATLLTQLLINAMQSRPVITTKENIYASKNSAAPLDENCSSLSAAIESAAAHRSSREPARSASAQR